ncbi:MAG: hypothetical protein QXS16_02330 [Pyrobaculum sp.]
MVYKLYKLSADETRDFLLWALRLSEFDAVLTYLDVPKQVMKEAELLENELYKEMTAVVTQALSKYIADDVKYYNIIDRQRLRNLSLVITILKRGEGVILNLTYAEHAYLFRRACREGILKTPCQFI